MIDDFEVEQEQFSKDCTHPIDPVNGEKRCSCRPEDMNWCEECRKWLPNIILENGDVKECWEHTKDFEVLWDVIQRKNDEIMQLSKLLTALNHRVACFQEDIKERMNNKQAF